MKTKYASNIVLLLTGTINTNNMHFTNLTDSTIRRNSYITTIEHYLSNYAFPIVFIENSNEDITKYFKENKHQNRLQIITYQGNKYPSFLGKGYGEMESIEYALSMAKCINSQSFIFKITGRYIIENAAKFFSIYSQNPTLEIIADLTNNFTWSASSIIGFTPLFTQRFLFKNKAQINDTKGFNFEHALAKAVLEAIGYQFNFQIFKHYPILNAISGTTGKAYKKAWWYIWPRQFKYFVRYLIVIR